MTRIRLRIAKPAPLQKRRRKNAEVFGDTRDVPHLGHVKTRGNCAAIPRPCPFATCKYNLLLEVTRTGKIKFLGQAREPDEMPADESCVLDLADNGGHTLETVGRVLGVTRERVRQIEGKGLKQARDCGIDLEDAPTGQRAQGDD